MRVLHISPSYYPAVRYGGPIFIADALTRGLVRRGHDVHVYTTNVDGPGYANVPVGEAVDREGVKIWYFNPSLGRRLYRSRGLAAAAARAVHTFDIVHIHAVFLWPSLVGARLARRHKIPYIVTPYGMLVETLIAAKSRFVKLGWLNLFERSNLANAAAVHIASEIEGEDIRKLDLNLKRLVKVPYCIDLPEALLPFCGSSRLSFDRNTRPYVLFLSRVNWKKGVDRLIRAMALVPQADLVIAGNDEEGYLPRLRKLAFSVGIADRLRIVGPVHGPQKWNLLRSAAVFALPSHSENFAAAVLEAMAVGCPVVVTPQVGLAKCVTRSGAGIVVDGEPELIAAAISKILGNASLSQEMGTAGMRVAYEQFSADVVAQQIEQVYLDALQDNT